MFNAVKFFEARETMLLIYIREFKSYVVCQKPYGTN